jgi:long-chain acyl-CoA synthetase
VPTGTEGEVFFENGHQFEYHNDPVKTRASRNAAGWTTLGDIGRLDEDGYLYLTDRKSFLIISGGVNIYPQEIENLLLQHEAVLDAAVFGIPNEEFGEEVKAVVQLVDGSLATAALANELISFCKQHLAAFKCPRSIDFRNEFPRSPTGKLLKRQIRDAYHR